MTWPDVPCTVYGMAAAKAPAKKAPSKAAASTAKAAAKRATARAAAVEVATAPEDVEGVVTDPDEVFAICEAAGVDPSDVDQVTVEKGRAKLRRPYTDEFDRPQARFTELNWPPVTDE